MESIPSQILNTIIMRPYFVIFFLTYLLGCSMNMGIKRTLLFCITGYGLAWLSEFSSIHSGIPYGLYYYIEETKGKELWALGVPFMDSMSFVFLVWASYSLALIATSPVVRSGVTIYLFETKKIRNSMRVRLLGAVFFVCLDVIIDPVALRGNRWFLGQIYGYPQPGVYFGVPVSNFVGWFVVGFVLISALQTIDRLMEMKKLKGWYGRRHPWRYLIGPSLHFGVFFSICPSPSSSESMRWRGLARLSSSSKRLFFISC